MSHETADAAARLARLAAAARDAWPELTLSDATFLAHLHAVAGEAAIEELHVEDLFLACALARGDAAAALAFDRLHLPPVARYVAHIDKSAPFADEVRQRVRERLLVAEPGAAPRIAEYAGRGPLGGLVRVSAIRIALNLRRGVKRETDLDSGAAAELPAPGADPELDYLRLRYRAEFQQAFVAALTGLAAPDRALLRGHHFEGKTIDDLAAESGVHRATVARRVQRAREALLEATRRELGTRLGAPAEELQSLIRLVRSHLDVSIQGFLRKSEVSVEGDKAVASSRDDEE